MPVEERRFKEMMEQQFGEKGATQAKICSHIMTETGTVFLPASGPQGSYKHYNILQFHSMFLTNLEVICF